MKRSKFTEEQIIAILKEHEAGAKAADRCRSTPALTATNVVTRDPDGGVQNEDLLQRPDQGRESMRKRFRGRMRDHRKIVAGIIAAAVFGASGSLLAQSAPDPDEANIRDLIVGSHILANEGVMDSFGHASVRSVKNPAHFFMPRAMPPGEVRRQDIVELDSAECQTANHAPIRLNGERWIHCEIYKGRPDVMSVIHTHDPAVLPLPLSGTPLKPVLAQAGFLPPQTPVFEVRDAPVAKKGMLVLTSALGQALVKALGDSPVVLMRGHGDTVVGRSVKEATVRAIYTDMDAKAEMAALALGPNLVTLNAAELGAYDAEERPDRPWENFVHRLPPSQR